MENHRSVVWIILILGVLLAFFVHLAARGELRGLKWDLWTTYKNIIKKFR